MSSLSLLKCGSSCAVPEIVFRGFAGDACVKCVFLVSSVGIGLRRFDKSFRVDLQADFFVFEPRCDLSLTGKENCCGQACSV